MIDQAGQLDRRITIQTFSETTDNFGQEVKSFSTLASVWANVVEKVGSEGEDGEMIAATKKVEFVIRYRTDVNEEMRISYNSNTYKIQAIQSADARKAFLKIVCLWSDAH
jgi:SPP1 family predicted phage head-tail adaptor